MRDHLSWPGRKLARRDARVGGGHAVVGRQAGCLLSLPNLALPWAWTIPNSPAVPTGAESLRS
ncbi:MAG: hypothetical protein ACRDK0_01205, partial [Solirubrobacteraceae bacterium]